MSGTKEGGRKAYQTNLSKNPDFYKIIGAIGGRAYKHGTSPPRGFAANPELASIVGKKGGIISRRGKAKKA